MRLVNIKTNLKTMKKKRIPFIFNDESTGSCIRLRLDLYMSHVKSIDVGIDHTCKAARLTRDCNNVPQRNSFYFSYSPTHPATRAHMCIRNAYVSVAVNVPAVTSRYRGTQEYARFIMVGEISKVTRNKRRQRHVHVKMLCYYYYYYYYYSRLRRLFKITHLKQTMFLSHILLQ
jgi:hypothetical protein